MCGRQPWQRYLLGRPRLANDRRWRSAALRKMPAFFNASVLAGRHVAGFFQRHRCSGIEVVRFDWLFDETRHYFRSKPLSWRIDRPGRRYRTKSTTNVSAIGTNPSPMTRILNAQSSRLTPMRLSPDQWVAQCSLCRGANYDRADPQICMRSRKGHPRRRYRVNTQTASGMVNMLEMTSASATMKARTTIEVTAMLTRASAALSPVPRT